MLSDASARELTDAVREAVRLASAEIAEEDELDFTEAAPVARSVEAQVDREGSSPTKRPAAVVRHRFDRQADAGPSRLITLRDRRRGRPPSRSSADPPR